MKNLFFVLAFSLFSQSYAWISDFEQAKKEAIATNKFIVIDFWASWCKPCVEMNYKTWSDSNVKKTLSNFVTVKLDINSNKNLASTYNVNVIPCVIVTDANGTLISSITGFKKPNEIIRYLENYIIDTSPLNNELLEIYKNNNFNTNLNIGIAYYDLSVNKNEEIKKYLVLLADTYIQYSKKKMSKEEKKNIALSQKIELLKLFRLAFLSKMDKLNETLLKEFPNETIKDSNKEFYYFLKYVVAFHYNLENKQEIKKELLLSNKNSKYIKIAEELCKVKN